MGTPDTVGRDAHGLAVGECCIDLKQVAHVRLDGNHIDVGVGKQLLPVGHHLLLLAGVDQRIEALRLCHQRIACNLVVADVGAQLHEAFRLGGQRQEMVVALELDVEVVTGIHGELIDDGLRKQTVVLVGQP